MKKEGWILMAMSPQYDPHRSLGRKLRRMGNFCGKARSSETFTNYGYSMGGSLFFESIPEKQIHGRH